MNCPNCEGEVKQTIQVHGNGRPPGPGDFTVCAGCGEALVFARSFDGALILDRPLSPIPPQVRAMQKVVRAALAAAKSIYDEPKPAPTPARHRIDAGHAELLARLDSSTDYVVACWIDDGPALSAKFSGIGNREAGVLMALADVLHRRLKHASGCRVAAETEIDIDSIGGGSE